jgi:YD repeat-containing protein
MTGLPATTGALVMSTTYDQNSNRATVVDQLSRTTSYSYDRLNRLTTIDYSDTSTPDVSYTYDANGSRLTMADGTGTTSYSAACPEERRDELGRLLSVTTGLATGATIACPNVTGGSRVGYRYDRDGNRTKLLYPNGDPVTYAFDKASRLTSVSDWASRATSYGYFPDGAL